MKIKRPIAGNVLRRKTQYEVIAEEEKENYLQKQNQQIIIILNAK